jgi:hypothetical protein
MCVLFTKEDDMCDYSLEVYRSQPAQEGVTYETHRFPSHSIGLVSPADRLTAICVACDMRLRLEAIPEHLQLTIGVRSSEVVTFTTLATDTYRDGIRFANGAEVSLQRLGTGVKATIVDALNRPYRVRETADAA